MLRAVLRIGMVALFALPSIAQAQYLDFPSPYMDPWQQTPSSPPTHMDRFNQEMSDGFWDRMITPSVPEPDPYGSAFTYDHEPLKPPEYWEERERQIQRDFGIDPESRRRAAERTLDEMNSGWPAINRQSCWFMDKNPAAQQRCFDALR